MGSSASITCHPPQKNPALFQKPLKFCVACNSVHHFFDRPIILYQSAFIWILQGCDTIDSSRRLRLKRPSPRASHGSPLRSRPRSVLLRLRPLSSWRFCFVSGYGNIVERCAGICNGVGHRDQAAKTVNQAASGVNLESDRRGVLKRVDPITSSVG